ncbi:hypothetical protein ISF_07134 [Cordyceps fumosorosea ARSEF 2679]|uniref:Uncharacterized protein n=1 Tax=Cordyceps fumosorosea (strain ARSEF 2679) TaxID=1081104 RepID=A0A167Q1Z2_CORFA|nr:hypothetical protein ISF_07134 [Cordyceps fumosorosea ARSEF 2679]OAA57213.1 hypothetical protein ISF_07134 [Cordyceps fumosorosea ARSEF 2679]
MVRPVDDNDKVNLEFPFACAGERPIKGFHMRLIEESEKKDFYPCDVQDGKGLKLGPAQCGPPKLEEDLTWEEIKALVDASPVLTDLLAATPPEPASKCVPPPVATSKPGTDVDANKPANDGSDGLEEDGDSDEPEKDVDSEEPTDGDSEEPVNPSFVFPGPTNGE